MHEAIDRIDLGALDADQLEELRTSALRLLDGIEQHLEWWNASVGIERRPFQFREDGPVFYAEAVERGVLINPALPDGFDNTEHEARSDPQRARWWLCPFIERIAWDGPQGVEAEERRNQERLRQHFPASAAADLEAHIATRRTAWFEAWPTGVRHEVFCLDGGCWDGPSTWGQFATLDEALDCVDERCCR